MEIWLTWIYHHNLTQRIFMIGCWSLQRYHSSRWLYYWGTAPPVFHQPTLLTSYFAQYFWQILDNLETTCGFLISSNLPARSTYYNIPRKRKNGPPRFPGRFAGATAARLERGEAAGGLRVGQEWETDRAATGGHGWDPSEGIDCIEGMFFFGFSRWIS